MSNNFKTCGEAWRYCGKYGLNNISAANSFQVAEALLRAFNDGKKEHEFADDERECNCDKPSFLRR